MNLLAKSCFAPGLIAMISNLISSSEDIEYQEIIDKEWFKDYAEGMGHEMYRIKIENTYFPDKISYTKIAEVAYSEYGAIVMALEI